MLIYFWKSDLNENENYNLTLMHLLPKVFNTVKLSYNDHCYNEFTLITNKIMAHIWSQMTGYKDVFHGYNESQL